MSDNVTPIRGATSTQNNPLSLKAQMVLGYISQEDYRRALKRANGGRIIAWPGTALRARESAGL